MVQLEGRGKQQLEIFPTTIPTCTPTGAYYIDTGATKQAAPEATSDFILLQALPALVRPHQGSHEFQGVAEVRGGRLRPTVVFQPRHYTCRHSISSNLRSTVPQHHYNVLDHFHVTEIWPVETIDS